MSPGLAIDKHILSSRDLETYADPPHAWSPAEAMMTLKKAGWEGVLHHPGGWEERLDQLLAWGSQDVQDILLKGKLTKILVLLEGFEEISRFLIGDIYEEWMSVLKFGSEGGN